LSPFFTPRCSAIHTWDTVVFFHSKPASSIFGGSVNYARPMESNIEIFLGRHSSEANADVGAPMPSARLVLAPPDDKISTINARPL
jgi:hypothetical protein